MSGGIHIEISPGELLDRISILQIKSERIRDAAKLANVRTELAAAIAVRDRAVPPSPRLDEYFREQKTVNETLWEIEDELRLLEQKQTFDARFIELARLVYKTNDRRAALKRSIDQMLGSKIVEEKQHPNY